MILRFPFTTPELIATHEGWTLAWDRSAEAEALLHFFENHTDGPSVFILHHADNLSIDGVISAFREIYAGPTISLESGASVDFWTEIVAEFADRTGLLPLSLGRAVIDINFSPRPVYSVPPRSKAMVDRIRSIRADGTAPTILELASSLNLAISRDPKASEHKVVRRTSSSIVVPSCFHDDYENDPTFRSFIDSNLFYQRSATGLTTDQIMRTNARGFKVIQFVRGIGEVDDARNTDIAHAAVSTINLDKALELLKPIASHYSDSADFSSFIKLLLRERSSQSPEDESTRIITQANLRYTIQGISSALAEAGKESSVAQRPSILKATVINEQLTILDSDIQTSSTSLEALNSLREQYRKEAQSLREILAGSNAGPGFIRRLEAVEASLSQEFTEISSLIMADQVRGLEIMLPPVSEIITDVTAADVAAFVGGMGLLSRQFPSWQKFVEEAENKRVILEDEEKDLIAASEILENQSDEVVSRALKDALLATREARVSTPDSILDFALIRAVGNAYRAIGHYILDRLKGASKAFNANIDDQLGDFISRSVLAGIITIAGPSLLQLAGGLPAEFAWIVSIAILLRNKT